MLSIYQLMKYLRNTHHINVKSSQTQALRNMGYYHGFKGYRFIREDTNRVNFSSLDEIIALNKYDMRLKTVLYPKVMFCLLYTSPSPRDLSTSRMPSSA